MELAFYKNKDISKKGRADLVNYLTGECWEVKPHMKGFNSNPDKYTKKALDQLMSYVEGILANDEYRRTLSDLRFHPGKAFIETHCYDKVTDSDIYYWSNGDGIIWYEVKKRQYLKPQPIADPLPEQERSHANQPVMNSEALVYAAQALLLIGAIGCIAAGFPAAAVAFAF